MMMRGSNAAMMDDEGEGRKVQKIRRQSGHNEWREGWTEYRKLAQKKMK